ncbi:MULTISPECIES: winged helix-turn-helix domain-containing protein [Streptomyces]|uniref:GntR family transcriptional regulator n=1 Tax=Streptomyces dengpaensis TaxID=2049881 RepID=A0ABM6SRG6_9ACTN|nr:MULTISPECIES: winged helix-turn-helix domain-containing protein [Streptomyces]AVH57194.1 GntR family transcriptional regulator [Streptomyces dengpaensis]PIB08904.1 GntR family transcriptional regulator [Streptomyces sp. HG99]
MTPDPGQSPIDPNKIAYVYMQMADHIAERIAKGELRPGARLPGERDLAAEYGVAHLTARRATRELRDRGLVVTLPSKGTFIAHPESDDTAGGDQQ